MGRHDVVLAKSCFAGKKYTGKYKYINILEIYWKGKQANERKSSLL